MITLYNLNYAKYIQICRCYIMLAMKLLEIYSYIFFFTIKISVNIVPNEKRLFPSIYGDVYFII